MMREPIALLGEALTHLHAVEEFEGYESTYIDDARARITEVLNLLIDLEREES
jgi:hypothetical protein